MSNVLVTGGSGFLAGHCILQLLAAGHEVRTTVRTLDKVSQVRAMLVAGGEGGDGALTFHIADLLQDAGWSEAVTGCDYVLHVASPFPGKAPDDEQALIRPARDGTLRVLRTARDAGVRRVVMTSSFAAVGYGHPSRERPFDEGDWTDGAGPDVAPYIKSKALAERAAWEFMEREGGTLELSVINPVGIFGPVLGPNPSASIGIIQQMLEGAMPATPRIYFGMVDVRDAADLHLRAMTHPAAAGERFIAVAGPALSLHQVARILRERVGRSARRVPHFEFPDIVVRVLARFVPALRGFVHQLGIVRHASNNKARTVLGWSPRSPEEAVTATAESLLRFGLLKR